MSFRIAAAALGSFLVLGASGALAASFAEIGDATDLLPGQAALGVGSLDSITGSLGSANDADVYRITISDPANFSAQAGGGLTGDTQLFLFDLSGVGIAMNDDCPVSDPCGLGSALLAGDPLYNALAPGEYLLGITRYDLDPVDGGGNAIFPDSPFGGINGPNGGVGPLAGWSASVPTSTLAYTIALTGAEFASNAVPEPSAALLYLAGFGALGARLRRGR